jgi:hypothetical protein
MSQPQTKLPLDRILAGGSIEGYDLLPAFGHAICKAEEWVGNDFTLECTMHGWAVRYRTGTSYRHTLLDHGRLYFRCPEDAIAALAALADTNRAKAAAEELAL